MLFPGAVLQPLIDPARTIPAPSGLYDAWIVAATAAELSWAVGAGAAAQPSRSGPLWGEVSFEGLRLVLVSTGVGPVNAALSLGEYVESPFVRQGPILLWVNFAHSQGFEQSPGIDYEPAG